MSRPQRTDLNSALKMIKFNVAAINCCTETEGPFKRLCIWFQGCDIHCKGCCNPDYQAFVVRNLMALDELIAVIKDTKDKHGIEGVTYSGGEPTLQQNLPELTKVIHALGLGVISFTGHLYEQVEKQLEGCDMVLDGAFEEAKLEAKRKILGSTNQRIICLTDRYKSCIDWFLTPSTKSIEINVGSTIFANGDKI